MITNPCIGIVGAGLAGISCALHLCQAGLRVELFDKSKGPSGRMSCREVQVDGKAWQCDHGAQYFTAMDPEFHEEVGRWEKAGVAAMWRPRISAPGGINDAFSGSGLDWFVGCPTMTAPAKHLAKSLKVTPFYTIDRFVRHEGGWRLSSLEHGVFSEKFDTVIVAIPATQTLPLVLPVSSELSAVAKSAHMKGCWTFMLRYGAPLDLPFDVAFVNRGPLRWAARDNSKPGRPRAETWVLHATTEWSEEHIEEEPEAVAPVLLGAFAELGGSQPESWTAQRWRYASTHPPLSQGFAWDEKEMIGLCGDWLNKGNVEGAWLSGKALARCILERYQGGGCTPSNDT